MFLGIDLGKKTTGFAISEGDLVTPYSTITHKSLSESVSKTIAVCSKLSIDKIVLGFVEGKEKGYFVKFKSLLSHKLTNIEIIMQDETLSTKQARETMIKISVPKEKRAKKEHEIAAGLILQEYLNNK